MDKSIKLSPPQLLAVSFLGVIIVGSVLLSLPWAVQNGHTDYITALFTATTSTCVTGLVVVDTGTYWTTFGHIIILLLIQIGGLGIMTFVTLFAFNLGRSLDLKQKILMGAALNRASFEETGQIVRSILLFTLIAEGTGAIILFWHWMGPMGAGPAAWYALFHSVSAFNNAGIDIFGGFQSLQAYYNDPLVIMITSILFITGGLGFLVIYELTKLKKADGQQRKLSLHTRVVLLATFIIIAAGSLGVYLMESQHALVQMSGSEKVLNAYYLAATRTCGFSTIDVGTTIIPTQILMMLLMFIGGAPSSTAGGIKVTTAVILGVTVYSVFRGKRDVEIAERRLPPADIIRGLTIVLMVGALIVLDAFILSFYHQDFMKVLFEVVSAAGTVGLSLGLTPELNNVGRILIAITMYLGRLGPATIAYALVYQGQPPQKRYPKGRIMIG